MYRSMRTAVPINKQVGLSIIEIMVALLLSSLLLLGLFQVFTSNSQSFRLNEANSRVQETGRIALEILSRAVRNAGYYGCQPAGGFNNNIDTGHSDFDESIHGFDQGQAIFSGNSGRPADALSGTDYIRVAGLAGEDLDLRLDGDAVSVDFSLVSVGDLEQGNIVFITDCSSGDIFQLSSVDSDDNEIEASGNSINDFSPNNPEGCTAAGGVCLSAEYEDGTRVMKGAISNYFLSDQPTHAEPALYRDSDALVSGVERMQVQYGTGPNLTVTDWKSVGDMGASDWPNVLAARISILVRSAADNVVVEPQTICFPGPTWDGQDCSDSDNLETMPDRRLYRVYTTTAALRNRVQ